MTRAINQYQVATIILGEDQNPLPPSACNSLLLLNQPLEIINRNLLILGVNQRILEDNFMIRI